MKLSASKFSIIQLLLVLWEHQLLNNFLRGLCCRRLVWSYIIHNPRDLCFFFFKHHIPNRRHKTLKTLFKNVEILNALQALWDSEQFDPRKNQPQEALKNFYPAESFPKQRAIWVSINRLGCSKIVMKEIWTGKTQTTDLDMLFIRIII